MKIGELAKVTDTQVETIRFYEQEVYCLNPLELKAIFGFMANSTYSASRLFDIAAHWTWL